MIYGNTKTTALQTEYGNASLEAAALHGIREHFYAVGDLLTAGAATEGELMGALYATQLYEDRFIVGVTGGFTEETY